MKGFDSRPMMMSTPPTDDRNAPSQSPQEANTLNRKATPFIPTNAGEMSLSSADSVVDRQRGTQAEEGTDCRRLLAGLVLVLSFSVVFLRGSCLLELELLRLQAFLPSKCVSFEGRHQPFTAITPIPTHPRARFVATYVATSCATGSLSSFSHVCSAVA